MVDALTLERVVASSCQDRPAIHRELQRSRLGAFRMSAFDCHTWADKIRLRLPHVKCAIHTGCAPNDESPLECGKMTQDLPPPIRLPSCEYAQVLTLVRAPRSFDLTTITVFCFRLFSTSQILMFENELLRERSGVPKNERTHRIVESTDAVMNVCESFGCQAHDVSSATCPLTNGQ